jgi:hypothetical protein
VYKTGGNEKLLPFYLGYNTVSSLTPTPSHDDWFCMMAVNTQDITGEQHEQISNESHRIATW